MMAQALAFPGSDTRQWVSYGWVAPDGPDARSVRFKDETGAIIPEGPLITVILQPSNIPVTCRVASGVSGENESEWHPFLERDEVIVAITSGDEREGPVIIGRLYNSLDKWPTNVAGMDTTNNTLAFKRMRTPYALECGHALVLRCADTACSITFDAEGDVRLNNQDGHFLALYADLISLQTAGSEAMLQLDPTNGTVGIFGKSFSFLMGEDEASLQTGGTVSFATSGNPPFEHVITTEAVVNLLKHLLTPFVNAVNAARTVPVGTGAKGDVFASALEGSYPAPGLIDVVVASLVTGAAGDALSLIVGAAVTAGLLSSKSANHPGVGCPGFLVG